MNFSVCMHKELGPSAVVVVLRSRRSSILTSSSLRDDGVRREGLNQGLLEETKPEVCGRVSSIYSPLRLRVHESGFQHGRLCFQYFTFYGQKNKKEVCSSRLVEKFIFKVQQFGFKSGSLPASSQRGRFRPLR